MTPGGGAFHPKVWVVRFVDDDDQPLIRVAVSSRNLTFDRSWDVALVSENAPAGRRQVPESRGLSALMRAVPGFAVQGLTAAQAGVLEQMAEEVLRTAFPAPAGCHGPVTWSWGRAGRVS